jgi:integrase
MPDDIPPELKQFVEQYIESVPQLEALLFLRNEPQREWTAAEIAKTLYLPEGVAGTLLADFVRRGVATLIPPSKDRYAYRTRDDETDRLIGQLQQAYHDRRVAVISLIYSKPLNKVQTFADAFRFSKENPK